MGVTFQQVQKYEKGTNRVGASRLQHIAHILQVPVPFFFEGVAKPADATGDASTVYPSYATEFLATSEGLTLSKAFIRINNPKLRGTIVALIEDLADGNLQ